MSTSHTRKLMIAAALQNAAGEMYRDNNPSGPMPYDDAQSELEDDSLDDALIEHILWTPGYWQKLSKAAEAHLANVDITRPTKISPEVLRWWGQLQGLEDPDWSQERQARAAGSGEGTMIRTTHIRQMLRDALEACEAAEEHGKVLQTMLNSEDPQVPFAARERLEGDIRRLLVGAATNAQHASSEISDELFRLMYGDDGYLRGV